MTQRNKTIPKEEDLNKYTEELQELILEKIKKKYSEAVIDHWQNPRNFRKLENPDGYTSVNGKRATKGLELIIIHLKRSKP